jgi:type 1 fimbria pilin
MMSTDSLAFTEFEEGITFDVDDPDFVNSNIPTSSDTSNTKAKNINKKNCSLEALGEYILLWSHELTP